MRRFALLLLCFGAFYFLIFHAFRVLTDVNELRTEFPRVIYSAADKTSHIEIQKERPPGWTPISAVSPVAVSAIMLSEDWAFYQHNGFDFQQMWDSFTTNLKKGKFARGGSTITQQTVKNVYLTGQKTIWRKIQEAILAIRVERHLSKRRILEIYLNIVEFGPGLYGIGPASQYYFQKPAAQLTAREGAFLAMLLPSPKKYSVSFRKKELTPYARSIIRTLLSKLVATGRLTQADYERELNTPFPFETVVAPPPPAGAGEPDEETVDDGQGGEEDDSTQLSLPDGSSA